jgi:hypothetical protein
MRAPFTLCTPLGTMLPSHHLSPGDARQQCALPSLRGRQPALHCLGGRGRAVEPAPLLRRTAIASAIAASATGQPRWPPPLRPMATAARPPLRLGPCATRRAPHSQHAGRRVACALRARCVRVACALRARCVRVACALRARCVRVAAMADGGRTRTLSRARVQLLMTDVEAAGTRGADGTLWSAHMQACRGCGTGTLLTSGAVHAPQALDESGSTVSEIIPSFLKISNQ